MHYSRNRASDLDKDTLKHTAIYSMASLLGKAVSLIMLPFYAHILRGGGYGVIGMIDASLSLLASLLAYGFQGTMIRFYHEAKDEDKGRVVSTTIYLALAATSIVTLPCVIFSKPLAGLILGDQAHSTILMIAVFAFLLDVLGQTAGTFLIINRRSSLFSTVSLLRLVLGLGLNILLVVVLRWGLVGYFLSSLAVAAMSVTVFLVIALKTCGFGYDPVVARKIISYQKPLIPGSVASWVARQVERVLVRFKLGIGEVGVLEMGYRFPYLIISFIIEPFMKSWETKRMELAEAESETAPVVIGGMFTTFLTLTVFLGLLLATGIRPILEIVTPPEFWFAARITQVEVLTTILFGCTMYMRFGLTFTKDTKSIALIEGVTSAVKVAVSYLFISTWGLSGAAFSACIAAAVTLWWTTAKAQRAWKMVLEYQKLMTILGLAVGLFLAMEQISFREWDFVQRAGEIILAPAIKVVSETSLATVKDGKILLVLAEKSDPLMELLSRITICTFGMGLFIIAQPGMRRRILQIHRMRRGGR